MQKREKQENKDGTSAGEESRGRDVSLGSHRGIVNRHQSLNQNENCARLFGKCNETVKDKLCLVNK